MRARALIVRFPVTSFFVIAFAGTWGAMLPLVLSGDGLGIVSGSVPFPAYVALFLVSTFSGPTLAAIVVTLCTDGRPGLRRLRERCLLWHVGAKWMLLATLGYPVMFLFMGWAVAGAAVFVGIRAHPLSFITTYVVSLLVFPALITWGEEPGWRGVALTRLQPKLGALRATLIVSSLHAIWHLPVFLLVHGPAAIGPFSASRFALNFVGIVAASVIWTWIFNRAKQSILIAVFLHAGGNAAQMWMRGVIPDAMKQVGRLQLDVLVVMAVVVLLATRFRLGLQSPADAAPAAAT